MGQRRFNTGTLLMTLSGLCHSCPPHTSCVSLSCGVCGGWLNHAHFVRTVARLQASSSDTLRDLGIVYGSNGSASASVNASVTEGVLSLGSAAAQTSEKSGMSDPDGFSGAQVLAFGALGHAHGVGMVLGLKAMGML
jgi:hypothetical protein